MIRVLYDLYVKLYKLYFKTKTNILYVLLQGTMQLSLYLQI